MAVIRVQKTQNYTVMSNTHLKDKNLSLKAKGLMSLCLSFRDDWNYSVRGLSAICKEGRDGILSIIRELERNGYVSREQPRGPDGKLGRVQYTIHEAPLLPQQESPCTEKPDTVNPDTVNPDTDTPYTENPSQLSTKELNTKESNTDEIKYRFDSFQELAEITAEEMRREREAYSALIKENIEYDFLIRNHRFSEKDIEEIFGVMLDTVCSTKAIIRVGGDDKPADIVKSQLLKLDSGHIEFVLDCLNENTSKIRNIRQYLLAALYNAPHTISNYYGALVNHDMYGGNL